MLSTVRCRNGVRSLAAYIERKTEGAVFSTVRWDDMLGAWLRKSSAKGRALLPARCGAGAQKEVLGTWVLLVDFSLHVCGNGLWELTSVCSPVFP